MTDHLSAEEAAAIAVRHGLRLDDALALRLLADDTAEAEHLAELFARRDEPAA